MASAICASSPAPRRRDNNFPRSAGHALPNVAQDVVCISHSKSALLAHVQPSAHDKPQVLPISAAAQYSAPSLGLLHLGTVLCIPLAEFQRVSAHIDPIPLQTEPVSGVSHTCLVVPEALLKVYPVSVPRLLMVSPVSALLW